MASNVIDLFAWNKALIDGRRSSTTQSVRLMFSDAARVDPLTYYGMGWFIGHDEWLGQLSPLRIGAGLHVLQCHLREQRSGAWMSVTLLTNSDGVTELERLADEIFFELRAG